MNKKNNIRIVASGELFGFPAEFGIARIDEQTVIAGSLNTKGKHPSDLIQNKELNITDLCNQVTVLPASDTDFSIHFAKKVDQYAFVLTSSGIVCGIMLSSKFKELILVLDTEKLRNGNDFERYIANVADWARISRLSLIVQNSGNGNNFLLLKQLSDEISAQVNIPGSYQQYQLIAVAMFDLNKKDFGKSVSKLTGLNELKLVVGGSFTEKAFGAELIGGRVETDHYIMEGFSLKLQYSIGSFCCIASGTFILKLENRMIGFTLAGAVSGTSFTLSASSLPSTQIPLNSRLSFSDLSLSIGVNSGAVGFGMTGRLNTTNLSIFAGFVVSPPRIDLFTAALTSTTGRISLKDIVVEIADIQWEPVINCLDIVAIGDFDLTVPSLSDGIKDFPENNNDENYETKRREIETKVLSEFNQRMDNTLQIKGKAQLTPLGQNCDQFILTDSETMRHYRIDRSGKISLNCQIYVCTQTTIMGSYEMPPGFFICGTLSIFNAKARFLFLIDKGKSLVALVQIEKIDLLHGAFVLSKSSKSLPIEPINGGLAGQLVKPIDNSAILYLSIQKNKGELIFYVDARIQIFNIFIFDSLVLIKDRFVFINIEYLFAGFKITFNLKSSYQSFTDLGFEASVAFDTSGFLEILKKAQETLKSVALSVQSGIEATVRKLNEAQQSVLNLQNQINNFNNRINQCRIDISNSRWYQIWIKIACAAEIVGLELAKAGVYVAIGVAYTALEIAKAAVNLGGAVVSTVLNSLAYVISAVTQVLWIKSLELGIIASPNVAKIRALLVLTVFGKDITINEELNLGGLIENVKNFVSNRITNKSDELIKDIKDGKVSRTADFPTDAEPEFLSKFGDLDACNQNYTELLQLREAVDNLFIDTNSAYFEAFNEENPDSRENACLLTGLRWEEEIFHEQHSDAFDAKFVESLETVIHTIREEQEKKRDDLSGDIGQDSKRSPLPNDLEQKMDTLLNTVRSIKEQKEVRRTRSGNDKSLFSRLEESIDHQKSLKRARSAGMQRSAEEANELYADELTRMISTHLDDKPGEIAEELRRTLGTALYQFRNPDNKFRRQDGDENNDDDDDDL